MGWATIERAEGGWHVVDEGRSSGPFPNVRKALAFVAQLPDARVQFMPGSHVHLALHEYLECKLDRQQALVRERIALLQVISQLQYLGLSHREIAALVGLSHQRICQLATEATAHGGPMLSEN
jgi:hypothetical protein